MRQVLKGSTNVSVDVYIIDSTDGTPETGVVFNTSGIDLEYRREGAAVVDITEADLATPALTDAHADGGFLAIGHGLYRLDVPDAAFATGVETVSIQGTVTGMIVLPQTIQLVDFDPEDGVRLGLTALPNAAADAAGGLPISDAGGLDIDAKLAATNEVTAVRMAALTDWINGGRLDLLLDAIPTTAMRGTDSAATAANLATVDTVVDAIKLETDKLTLGDAGAGTAGSIIEEIENRPTTAMRGTDSAATEAKQDIIDTNVDSILVDTAEIGPAGAGLSDLGGMSTGMKAEVNVEVDTALNTAIPASPTTDSINEVQQRLGRSVGVVQEYTIDNTSFTATTTQAQVDAVDIGSLEATDDHFIGRIIIFTSGANIHQATDITDYDGTNKRFTYTAVTDTPADDDKFIVV